MQAVEDRKRWSRFGDAVRQQEGDSAITGQSNEEIPFEKIRQQKQTQEEKKADFKAAMQGQDKGAVVTKYASSIMQAHQASSNWAIHSLINLCKFFKLKLCSSIQVDSNRVPAIVSWPQCLKSLGDWPTNNTHWSPKFIHFWSWDGHLCSEVWTPPFLSIASLLLDFTHPTILQGNGETIQFP